MSLPRSLTVKLKKEFENTLTTTNQMERIDNCLDTFFMGMKFALSGKYDLLHGKDISDGHIFESAYKYYCRNTHISSTSYQIDSLTKEKIQWFSHLEKNAQGKWERIDRTLKEYGRVFPVTLRNIIFERDSYTCQLCLRNRNMLMMLGLHLECDHIIEWEDGGKTNYDNGRTVCCECNKGKHHSKRYINAMTFLRELKRQNDYYTRSTDL